MSAGAVGLILSAAYVDQELSAEFGPLPPCFLPVGDRRLYALQVERMAGLEALYLTLPAGFETPAADRAWLEAAGVRLLFIEEGLSLGESLVRAMEAVGPLAGDLIILHGDTLAAPASAPGDSLGVSAETDEYAWAQVAQTQGRVTRLSVVDAAGAGEEGACVVCGVFRIADPGLLATHITAAEGDFIRGLNAYALDRPLRAEAAPDWLDFGHVQTYFRARRVVSTARSFNSLAIDDRVVTKRGEDHAKIRAEAAWLGGIPATIRPFCVRMVEARDAEPGPAYVTEYAYAPTLADLSVFGALGAARWGRIFASCQTFLDLCAQAPDPDAAPGSSDAALETLVRGKARERLLAYAAATGATVDQPMRYAGRVTPSLLQIADRVADIACAPTGATSTVMHGDFCFSNILYDLRARRIRVLDPRGFVVPGRPSLYGSPLYDLGKLAHSVVGRYDELIADRYALEEGAGGLSLRFAAAERPWMRDMLRAVRAGGVGGLDPAVQAVMVSLFLAMPPLHADRPDRQKAFIANALRLFLEMEAA